MVAWINVEILPKGFPSYPSQEQDGNPRDIAKAVIAN